MCSFVIIKVWFCCHHYHHFCCCIFESDNRCHSNKFGCNSLQTYTNGTHNCSNLQGLVFKFVKPPLSFMMPNLACKQLTIESCYTNFPFGHYGALCRFFFLWFLASQNLFHKKCKKKSCNSINPKGLFPFAIPITTRVQHWMAMKKNENQPCNLSSMQGLLQKHRFVDFLKRCHFSLEYVLHNLPKTIELKSSAIIGIFVCKH